MRRRLAVLFVVALEVAASACESSDGSSPDAIDDAGPTASDASSSGTDARVSPPVDASGLDASGLDAATREPDASDAAVVDAAANDAAAGDAAVGDAAAGDAATVDPRNDEFTSAATIAGWSEYNANRHASLDIAATLSGFLTIVPQATSFNGWYSEYEGNLFYRTATGNFVVETLTTLGTATNRSVTPTLQDCYAQAGFVVRDPASAPHLQRWIMYNLGYQDSAVAREIKTTIPSPDGLTDSLSTLHLNNTPLGTNTGRLRVCRVGADFHFFHRHPSEGDWVEETFRSSGAAPTRVLGNGPKPARADNSPLSFTRPDMPNAVQVGLYVGNYAPPPNGTRGDFDYIRFGTVSTLADCTKPLP